MLQNQDHLSNLTALRVDRFFSLYLYSRDHC